MWCMLPYIPLLQWLPEDGTSVPKHVEVDTRHKRCLIKCIYTGRYIESYLISDFGIVSRRGPGVKTSWLFWDVSQRFFVVVYRHFGIAYQSHLQQHSSPETSVRDYQRTLCNIAEELRHQLHCSGSLESRGKIYALIRPRIEEIIQHIKNI